MEAHAAAVEVDGWDGMFFMDSQNLSMDVFGSLYLAASATSRLEPGTAEECTERLCQLIGLGLSHLVIVGGSRDIDATVRERSDHLVAREVLPAVRAAFA